MAMYIVVVWGNRVARLDEHTHDLIVKLMMDGKPVLVCLNQMSRFLSMCRKLSSSTQQCLQVKQAVLEDDRLAGDQGVHGDIDVCLTELIEYKSSYQELSIHNAEYVSQAVSAIPLHYQPHLKCSR